MGLMADLKKGKKEDVVKPGSPKQVQKPTVKNTGKENVVVVKR
jgi:hypothetical protein